jgi:hypothetical protein
MNYLCSGLVGRKKSEDWLRLFDVVIVGCAKVRHGLACSLPCAGRGGAGCHHSRRLSSPSCKKDSESWGKQNHKTPQLGVPFPPSSAAGAEPRRRSRPRRMAACHLPGVCIASARSPDPSDLTTPRPLPARAPPPPHAPARLLLRAPPAIRCGALRWQPAQHRRRRAHHPHRAGRPARGPGACAGGRGVA